MKRRITKKGEFICRRQNDSDKSFMIRESMRLAFFEMEGKPAFVVRKRKCNNVILVTRNKKEALNLTSRLNKWQLKTTYHTAKHYESKRITR